MPYTIRCESHHTEGLNPSIFGHVWKEKDTGGINSSTVDVYTIERGKGNYMIWKKSV